VLGVVVGVAVVVGLVVGGLLVGAVVVGIPVVELAVVVGIVVVVDVGILLLISSLPSSVLVLLAGSRRGSLRGLRGC
jgi:hypothetical protein